MKRNNLLFLFLLCFLYSCKSKDKQPAGKSENDIDAARNFIQAALENKYEAARTFMLRDSANDNYMDIAERSFNHIDQAEKDSFRTASIIIHDVAEVNDSTSIITYSNSYKKQPFQLKVVKANNQWLVDFKYLYKLNPDSLSTNPILKDSIK